MAKQIDTSTVAVRAIAGLAVLIAGLCTTSMNWFFGYQLGASPVEGHVLGAFSVALDVLKWFALGLAAIAFERRAWARAGACLAIWLVAVAYSCTAGFGFSTLTRTETASKRTEADPRIVAARLAFKEASDELALAKGSERWASSSACTNATVQSSMDFCANVQTIQAKAAKAQAVIDGGAGDKADPQAATVARWTGWSQERAQVALSLTLVAVAEVVSAFGLFAVMAPPTNKPRPVKAVAKKPKRRAKQKPVPKQVKKANPAQNVLPFARSQ